MRNVQSIETLRTQINSWRKDNQTIAFVATMGNLHQGHLALLAKAQQLADKVVVSIFVNPLQFDNKQDLTAYPRTIEADLHLLEAANCDLVFNPSGQEMYPNGMTNHSEVSVANMDDKLCGLHRPGHFNGVATVVLKLLNIVQADIALFGEKDFQQLQLIKTMVADLNLAVEIVGVATHREPSGLAMSSRNQYLNVAQRQQAAALHQSLLNIKDELVQGMQDYKLLQQQQSDQLNALGFTVEYIEIRRDDNLALAQKKDKSLRILVAAQLGRARLIDNIACVLA